MEKKIIIFTVLISLVLTSFGQQLTYLQSNNDTYQEYLHKDWRALIKSGKLAEKNKLDYYYLNVRMGVAYFKLGKYMLAIPYFEKAKKENPKDAFVLDYLYYSYLYAGNEKYSLSVYSDLPENLQKNKQIASSKLKDIDIGFGYHINQDYNQLSVENYKEADISDVKINLDKVIYNSNFGLNFQMSKKIFLYQELSYRRANYLFIEQNSSDYKYDMSINEFRYYGKIDFLLGQRWTATSNYNLLFGTYQDLIFVSSYGRWSSGGGYKIQTFLYGNFSTGFSIKKQWNHFELRPHIDLFSDKGMNLYLGSDIILYPLGNADLYLRTDLSYNALSNNESPLVIKAEAGFRLWKLFFTGTYYYGKMQYFVEDDGRFLYNFNETILNQEAFSVQFFNKNKIYFASIIPATYEMSYSDASSSYSTTEYFKTYNKLLIKFGIKWKLRK